MAGDRDRTPGCEACYFIGRICPPDCPFAPHFVSGRTRTGLRDKRGRTVTECARCYDELELRRLFVEGATDFFSGAFPGEEVKRLLVEAILSEAEKGLEPPPEPPLHSSYSSPVITPFEKEYARVAWELEDRLRSLKYSSLREDHGNQDSEGGPRLPDLDGTNGDSDDKGDDAHAQEVELAGTEKPLEESGTSAGIDRNLGVNADQDSILPSDKD